MIDNSLSAVIDCHSEGVAELDMKEIRAMTGLSQVKFAELYGIPVRSIQNWEMDNAQTRHAQDYVLRMLERIVREDFGIDN